MDERDVIISVLGCGGKMSCAKEAKKFKNPPLVVNINSSGGISTGGGTVQGFRKAAKEYKTNGSIIDGILEKHNVTPRRICLVSYLDGWSFIHEILKVEPERVCEVICLEGLNTKSTSVWSDYAFEVGHDIIFAYTERTHKTASSRSAAMSVMKDLVAGDTGYFDKQNKRKILEHSPDSDDLKKSISIYSKNETPKTKIYHKDPILKSYRVQGVQSFLFSGKKLQDQTYIQQYVQPKLWEVLKRKWDKDYE